MHPHDMTGGETRAPSSPKLVPLILSDEHREAIREDCLSALRCVLDDLRTPDRLPDPAATAGEGEVFRRLLEALDREEISVPDEEMRARIERLSESYDRTVDVEEIMATRDAHKLLLGVLDGSREEGEGVRSPGSRWLDGDDEDCRREVLSFLLSESPHCLEFDDLVVALAGDPESLPERNALKDAVTVLSDAGLVRRQRGALAPTRAARQMAELGFAIG
jgi:hypothetical protein